MPTYKLYYFDGMGKAEVTRLLFALGGQEFQDIRLTREQWPEFKPKTPFGQMPVLEVDGEMVAQTKVIEQLVARRLGKAGKTDMEEARGNMITCFVEDRFTPLGKTFFMKEDEKKEAREKFCREDLPNALAVIEEKLAETKNGLFGGDDIAYADLFVYQSATKGIEVFDYVTVDLSKFPKIAALCKKVEANKNIAAYLAKRPKSQF